MKIGVAKEIKVHEYRVGLTPACAHAYVSEGHTVQVENNAGLEAGFPNEDYVAAGATIAVNKQQMFDECEMIIKVKEPIACEYDLFHEGQILYTYLHLAADKPQTEALMKAGVKAIAYETIELPNHTLPCLKPMSEIAGRLAVQEGAKYLEKTYGGRGVLLGGIPGVEKGKVAILGGGVVGLNACKMAVGLGADVTILDINADRLAFYDDIFSGRVHTLYSTKANIEKICKESDLIIGAVLLPGAKAPHLIRSTHLKLMKKGVVLVDVAVDQGGCFETTQATTHNDPTFEVDGVIHYCVANMPGAVALTSTLGLTSATLSYGLMLANFGVEGAVRQCEPLKKGVNVYNGKCVYKEVANVNGLEYTPLDQIME